MRLKLLKKQDEATDIKSFFFEPEAEVSYKPGQYFYYTLTKLNYPDARGDTRHFTISSSPTEGKTLRLTTRIREESGFKKTLDELVLGGEVKGEGPGGTFFMDENTTGNHIFLAGGIGITPYRSMIKFIFDKKMSVNISLIYSVKNKEVIAFKEELDEISQKNSNFKMRIVDSSTEGHVNDKIISEVSKDIANPTYWISGPPEMVDAMEGVLITKLKVPVTQIRPEKFTGY